MPISARETFERIIQSTYQWMQSAHTPANFHCPIKNKQCMDVEFNCPECPLKSHFTERLKHKDWCRKVIYKKTDK